jgi:hypothetical protein
MSQLRVNTITDEAMETGNVPSVEDVIKALPKWSGGLG